MEISAKSKHYVLIIEDEIKMSQVGEPWSEADQLAYRSKQQELIEGPVRMVTERIELVDKSTAWITNHFTHLACGSGVEIENASLPRSFDEIIVATCIQLQVDAVNEILSGDLGIALQQLEEKMVALAITTKLGNSFMGRDADKLFLLSSLLYLPITHVQLFISGGGKGKGKGKGVRDVVSLYTPWNEGIDYPGTNSTGVLKEVYEKTRTEMGVLGPTGDTAWGPTLISVTDTDKKTTHLLVTHGRNEGREDYRKWASENLANYQKSVREVLGVDLTNPSQNNPGN
jgi:hypothetical protein